MPRMVPVCALLLLLLSSVAVAAPALSEECEYVATTRVLTDIDKLEACFNSYQIDQDVVDALYTSLEIMSKFYPYSDIAMNPPSEPAGYFKRWNFTEQLENLKDEFDKSDRIVSKVFRPTQRLIQGFRDGHFSLIMDTAKEERYLNIFESVTGQFPFYYFIDCDGDDRKVYLYGPDERFLSQDTVDAINNAYDNDIPLKSVDDKDPLEYFANFLGDFNDMKSPQGRLVWTNYACDGFYLLQAPLDDAFATHKLVFDDDTETTAYFKMAYGNRGVPARSRDEELKEAPKSFVNSVSFKQMEKSKETIKNFRPSPLRKPHEILPCAHLTGMNYIEIDSFNYDADDFINELVDCASIFDTNDDPITIILPLNGGGDATLLAATQLLLTPSSDVRVVDAMRHSPYEDMAIAVAEGYGWSSGLDTCEAMSKESEFKEFFSKTEKDDLGNGVIHERTRKVFEDVSYLKQLLPYRIMKHVRKPTDIILVTDGFCFSSCALFVNNLIESGAAIAAGMGPTFSGGDIFAAGQCPSGVIEPDEFFDEMKNNAKMGLSFSVTVLESYEITKKYQEKTPLDYLIVPVDTHTGFYYTYTGDDEDLAAILALANGVRQDFQTHCNPNNKRLLFITDECTSDKPHARYSGYVCGSNGQWDHNNCKIAVCEDGYSVDYVNNECVPNLCSPSYSPEPEGDSSVMVHPMSALLCVLFFAFYRLFF